MLTIIVLAFLALTVATLSFQFVCYQQYTKRSLFSNKVESVAEGYSLSYAR
jgi:hypothetical protein